MLIAERLPADQLIMAKKTITPVKGGLIKREASTGRLKEVVKLTGEASRSSSATFVRVNLISDRRSAALKRLADR